MVTGLLNCFQGAFPVAISSVVQPRLQMSALRQDMPPPSSRITSGAIQEGVPARRNSDIMTTDFHASQDPATTQGTIPPSQELQGQQQHLPLMSPLEVWPLAPPAPAPTACPCTPASVPVPGEREAVSVPARHTKAAGIHVPMPLNAQMHKCTNTAL
jgi:hypothetical protein